MAKKRIRPRGGPKPRSFGQFRREVVALLEVGHRIPRGQGTRLVELKKAFVRRLWRAGKPPCAASDTLASLARRRSHGRDADSPNESEVFESRAGNRWRVVGVTDKSVEVERAGHRQSGKLRWARTSLRGMKQVEDKVRVAGDMTRKRRLTRKGRDADTNVAHELRKLSLSALGRLLRKAARQGNERMLHLLEKEIDRRQQS